MADLVCHTSSLIRMIFIVAAPAIYREPLFSFQYSVPFNVHTQSGFQFNRVPIGPDRDFLHPTLDQNFIKLCQIGGLAADEILKLRDTANLLVPS